MRLSAVREFQGEDSGRRLWVQLRSEPFCTERRRSPWVCECSVQVLPVLGWHGLTRPPACDTVRVQSYLEAWVRQNCQLAFSSATTTTFPRCSPIGLWPWTSQRGAGSQISDACAWVTCEAHSRAGRAAHCHRDQRDGIVPTGAAPLSLPVDGQKSKSDNTKFGAFLFIVFSGL